MNRLLSHGLLLIVCSGMFASCSFHRKVTRRKAQSFDRSAMQPDSAKVALGANHAIFPLPDTSENVVVPDTSAAKKQLVDQLTPIWKNRINYKTFAGKAKVHFEGPDDKQEFTANFRVRKDSVIWVNVSALGLSVARILVTPDSFFMVIPIKREAKRIPLSQAAKILPTKVDFTSLQNLILGEPLRDGTIDDATSFGGSWSLEVSDSAYMQRITYNKADTTIRTGQLRTRNPNGPQAISQYGSYEMIDGRRVSTQRVLNIQNGDDVYMLDMNFSKEEFDIPLEYPFSIPKGYSEK